MARLMVVDGENGLLVPIERHESVDGPCIEALAGAQIDVLDKPSLRTRLTAAARKAVATHYSREGQLHDVLALYADLIAGSTTGAAARQRHPRVA